MGKKIAGAGFEPTTSGLWARRATGLLHPAMYLTQLHKLKLERETGLEPATTCLEGKDSTTELFPQNWTGKDSNLRRRMPTDLQSAPVGHLGTCPYPHSSIICLLFFFQDARADDPA
jgi:hypothetical protein